MKCGVLLPLLWMITSTQLFADWSGTGNWVSNDENDSLVGLRIDPDGTLLLAIEMGDSVAVVVADWDYKPENCWTDKLEKVNPNALTRKTIASGNLLITTADGKCCLNAERVGDNLILSKIWVEGDEPLMPMICADFDLSRK